MRNTSKLLIPIILMLISSGIILNSCQNEESPIGLGIIPGSDQMELFCDTFNVRAYTVSDLNIATDERSLATLGSYVDPVFGFSKASFICQTRISSNNVDFSDVVKLNSLELHLKYDFHYGDIQTAQTLNIYRLLNDVYIDSVYYASYKPELSDLELLTTLSLDVPMEDSLLKITLPIELAQEFIDADSTNFTDNDAFIQYFKGFYLTTENLAADGCIYSFDLYDSDSRMMLYFNDSLDYEFYINTKSAAFNMFEHDYSLASADIQTAVADSTGLYDYCYVQSLGGLKTKLFFTDLDTLLSSSNIAINKAQLTISIQDNYNEQVYVAPPKMTLVAVLENGKYDFLTDYKVNSTKFGGDMDTDYYTYTFNIPFHIQELINGNTDYGLYLFATENRTKPYRVILNNKDGDKNAIKLEIYYSKY